MIRSITHHTISDAFFSWQGGNHILTWENHSENRTRPWSQTSEYKGCSCNEVWILL